MLGLKKSYCLVLKKVIIEPWAAFGTVLQSVTVLGTVKYFAFILPRNLLQSIEIISSSTENL